MTLLQPELQTESLSKMKAMKYYLMRGLNVAIFFTSRPGFSFTLNDKALFFFFSSFFLKTDGHL